MLGVYEMQERLTRDLPDLLLETVGGGARFDPGMLYYSPQIWCWPGALELGIQEGTALIIPLSAMGGTHFRLEPLPCTDAGFEQEGSCPGRNLEL